MSKLLDNLNFYRAGIFLVDEDDNVRFNVSAEGVIDIGTISLKKRVDKAFQVVVPGISTEENYTLSVFSVKM